MSKSKSKNKSAPADKIYYVEKILEKKIDAFGRAMYLVKWQNYSSAWNSWEPIEMFKDPVIVKNFEAQLASEENQENQPNLQNQPRKPRKDPEASCVEECTETIQAPVIIEPKASCDEVEIDQVPAIEPQASSDEECSEPNQAPAVVEPQAAQPPPNTPVWITKAFLGMSHAAPKFISFLNENRGGVDPLALNGFEFEFSGGSKRELTLVEACDMHPDLVEKYMEEHPEVNVYVMPDLEHR